MKINKNKKKKSVIVGIVIVALLIIGGTIFAWMYLHKKPTTNANDNTFGKVNYNPPTTDDKAYNDRIKQQLGNDAQSNNSSPSTDNAKKSVTVTVVDASQYGSAVEVRAFVPGTTESGGECTFTFTSGSNQVVRKSSASAGAQTTSCANLSIDKTAFNPTGSWSLVVSYDSTTSSGKSDTKTVEIH